MPGKPIIDQPTMLRLPPWIGSEKKPSGTSFSSASKKPWRIDAVELDLAGLDLLEHIILLVGRKLREFLSAKTRRAMLVEAGQALAIEFGRRLRRLRPLLLGALGMRPELVEPVAGSVRSLQLAIDEDSAAGLLAARSLRVGWNDPVHDRLDRAGFIGREELPGTEPLDPRRG